MLKVLNFTSFRWLSQFSVHVSWQWLSSCYFVIYSGNELQQLTNVGSGSSDQTSTTVTASASSECADPVSSTGNQSSAENVLASLQGKIHAKQ
jgi:hypothetical protein